MEYAMLLFWTARESVRSRAKLVVQVVALRQQLMVQARGGRRVRLRHRDRIFWMLMLRLFRDWRDWLVIVKPETVVGWHRLGFRIYWRWKSKPSGRPKVQREVRDLIRQMASENPTWGAPRIRDELRLLGFEVAKSTVDKYMRRRRGDRPTSPTWKMFLKNHAKEIVAADFLVVPTATFRQLYCFVMIRHDTRQVVHFNVTEHPTAEWAAQQVVEAFPFDEAPRYLLRDNDSIYGNVFQERVKNLGIEEVRTAYHSPWQNAYAERLIGSIRRECLDHMIVLNEAHLKRILTEYFEYYNEHRAHQGIDGDAPMGRNKEPPDQGDVVAIPYLGGLHHRYTRQAA